MGTDMAERLSDEAFRTSAGSSSGLNRTRLAEHTGVVVIRVAGLGLGFASLAFATRTGGADAGGELAAVLAWSAILAVPLHLGWPQLAIRFGTTPEAQSRVRQSTRPLDLVATPVAAAATVLTAAAGARPAVVALASTALFLAWLRVDEGWLRSRVSSAKAVILLTLVAPLALGTGLVLLSATTGVTKGGATAVATGSFALCAVAQRTKRLQVLPAISSPKPIGSVGRSVLLVGLSSGSSILTRSADLAVAAIVLEPASVAAYALASRLAQAVSMVLFVVNATTIPRLARNWQAREFNLANRELNAASLFGTLTALLGILVLPIIAEPAFSWSGLPFDGELIAVIGILAVGQLISVACGPVLAALNVTGNEQSAMRVQAATLLVLAVLLGVGAILASQVWLAIAAATANSVVNLAARARWAISTRRASS